MVEKALRIWEIFSTDLQTKNYVLLHCVVVP